MHKGSLTFQRIENVLGILIGIEICLWLVYWNAGAIAATTTRDAVNPFGAQLHRSSSFLAPTNMIPLPAQATDGALARGGNSQLPVCHLLFFLMLIITLQIGFMRFIGYQKKVEAS